LITPSPARPDSIVEFLGHSILDISFKGMTLCVLSSALSKPMEEGKLRGNRCVGTIEIERKQKW
jgi:hypothetical protein